MQSNRFLYFSGVPVICRSCGTQLKKSEYRKGHDGSYLCKNCYDRIYGKYYKVC